MLNGKVVVDSVVHPYNLSPSNQLPEYLDQLLAVHASHLACTGPDLPDFALTREEFLTDFDPEALASALFAESPVDLAILHSLPNLGFTKGFVTDPDEAARLRDRYPGRFLLYATVDTPIADTAITQLERQVRELKVDGLKLYPAFFYDGLAEGWRMDDQNFATPLLTAALDLGIRNVAVHKAIPVPPAPEEAFRVDDLHGALGAFPEINFHIVHAGVTFLSETCELMAQHPNLYANLESTFAYILRKPARFADVLGALLAAAGSGRLLFGSGVNLVHPRPLLEAFENFELSAETLERHGVSPLSDDDKAAIVGLNALRLHGLSADSIIEQTSQDAFVQARSEAPESWAAPWSRLRSPSMAGR